ncbi:MAG: VOC family protein [Gemmatimonadaceae bacterium]|nr:VOC family protein [Acetobacteraceae bacterium]
MNRPNYIELPATDIASSQDFYSRAFDWTFTDYGPTYAATTTGDVDVGLQADPTHATAAPLPVIQVPDLAAALNSVRAAGGTITRPPFAYPGGQRFHFRDPGGNELAAYTPG